MRRALGSAGRLLATSAALAVLSSASAAPPDPSRPPVSVTPSRISAGLLYDGGTIYVHGAISDGSQVAVRIVGPTENRRFGRRGKIGGLIWGGVGHVSFRNAPSLYALHTSAPLDALAAPTLRQQLRLGYETFAPRIVVEGSPGAEHARVEELIHLKESEGLYSVALSAIQLAAQDGGFRAYHVALPVPAHASPGAIEVAVLEFRDGAMIRSDVQSVHLEHTGLPATLGRLARDHGPAFGVLSVLVLLLTGLAVELVRGGIGMILERTARERGEGARAEADTGGSAPGSS